MENKQKKKRFDLKRAGKKTAQAAAGAGLAVSLFFGSTFSSPADIMEPDAAPQTAIVEVAEGSAPGDDLVIEAPAETGKRGFRQRMRAWLKSLPAAVRALLIVPMWAVGFGIIWLVSLLAGLVNVPILGGVIKFIIGAVVAGALVLAAQKLLFPDIPLKRLLSRGNLTALAVTAAVIGLMGAFGGLLREDLPWLTAAVDCGAVALYVLFFLLFVKAQPKGERGAAKA